MLLLTPDARAVMLSGALAPTHGWTPQLSRTEPGSKGIHALQPPPPQPSQQDHFDPHPQASTLLPGQGQQQLVPSLDQQQPATLTPPSIPASTIYGDTASPATNFGTQTEGAAVLQPDSGKAAPASSASNQTVSAATMPPPQQEGSVHVGGRSAAVLLPVHPPKGRSATSPLMRAPSIETAGSEQASASVPPLSRSSPGKVAEAPQSFSHDTQPPVASPSPSKNRSKNQRKKDKKKQQQQQQQLQTQTPPVLLTPLPPAIDADAVLQHSTALADKFMAQMQPELVPAESTGRFAAGSAGVSVDPPSLSPQLPHSEEQPSTTAQHRDGSPAVETAGVSNSTASPPINQVVQAQMEMRLSSQAVPDESCPPIRSSPYAVMDEILHSHVIEQRAQLTVQA